MGRSLVRRPECLQVGREINRISCFDTGLWALGTRIRLLRDSLASISHSKDPSYYSDPINDSRP